MKTLKTILAMAALLPLALNAQDRYATRTGTISFYSSTPMEDIEAHNRKVSCVYDASTGAIELAALIKAFDFKKALMQEHFNENYMESNTYPKATFKGTLSGVDAASVKKAGTYDVVLKGDLTMHGVTRAIEEKGTLTAGSDGTLKGITKFSVKPEDYNITIPGVVRKNIAEQIQISVDLALAPM